MIKLKDGRYYKDRTGRVFLVYLNDTRNPRYSLYPFTGRLVDSDVSISFAEDGKYCSTTLSVRDLVEEVEYKEEDEVSPHDGKADQGKVDVDRLDRYFPDALLEVAKVLEFGAKKYTEGGWSSVPNGINRYQAAARRHKLARNRGEVLDPESNLEHWAHQICSELMAFSLYLKDK